METDPNAIFVQGDKVEVFYSDGYFVRWEVGGTHDIYTAAYIRALVQEEQGPSATFRKGDIVEGMRKGYILKWDDGYYDALSAGFIRTPVQPEGVDPSQVYQPGNQVEVFYRDGYYLRWESDGTHEVSTAAYMRFAAQPEGTDPSAIFQAGDKVIEAYCARDRTWWMGTVTEALEDYRYLVKWDAGSTYDILTASYLRIPVQAVEEPPPAPVMPDPSAIYRAGDKVEGFYSDSYRGAVGWMMATVEEVLEDGRYLLKWDDGGSSSIFSAADIRLRAQDTSKLGALDSPVGVWNALWTTSADSAWVYSAQLTLKSNPANGVTGSQLWKVERSPYAWAGKTATEYLSGIYDPTTRMVTVVGVSKHDPEGIIALDSYRLKLSTDGQTLSGESLTHAGNWGGSYTSYRVGSAAWTRGLLLSSFGAAVVFAGLGIYFARGGASTGGH